MPIKHMNAVDKARIGTLSLVVSAVLCFAPAGTAFAMAVTPPACPANFPSEQLFRDTGNASRTGTPSTFTVPATVTNIHIIAVGADGGVATDSAANTGGTGASIQGRFAVTPGQTVTVIPGYAGLNGEFESGGGGASGAYIVGSLAVIAGGGGGDDNTGNGSGATATNNASNGGNPAGLDCNAGGLGGTAGAGGEFGELPLAPQTIACQTGDGGAGGGGFSSAGGTSDDFGSAGHSGPSGGAQCSIAGAVGGIGGLRDPGADTIGADGGFGICGGGGADNRESGGGGGYSGGGGGPEGQFPGGGGSFIAATATNTTLTAGTTGGGSGRNGAVRICYPALPVLRLQKALQSGRFVSADQFALTIAGTGGPATVTTTGTGTTATGVATLNPGAFGASYNFGETGASGALLSNYTTTYSCTNTLTGGQTPSGSGTSFSLTAVAGDDLTCTLSNTRNTQADLRISKTNTPGLNGEIDQAADTVVSGATVSYSIVVTNLGPDSANNTLLTDPPPSNLICSTASCTAGGGAACPVPTGAALVAALQGAGATIPTLPNGGSITVQLICTAN